MVPEIQAVRGRVALGTENKTAVLLDYSTFAPVSIKRECLRLSFFFSPFSFQHQGMFELNSTVAIGLLPPSEVAMLLPPDNSGSRGSLLFYFRSSHRGCRRNVIMRCNLPTRL